MRRTIAGLFLLGGCLPLAAANVSGAWHLKYTNEEGQVRESTLQLEEKSGAVTGSITSVHGKAEIESGTVKGDHIAFLVVRKSIYDEVPIHFTGVVKDSSMKLAMKLGQRKPVPMTATRDAAQ